MLKKVIISLALLSLGASCGACLPAKNKILSGGEFYPEGCTVDGKALYTPDVQTRTFSGPHYVIPEETLNALIEL